MCCTYFSPVCLFEVSNFFFIFIPLSLFVFFHLNFFFCLSAERFIVFKRSHYSILLFSMVFYGLAHQQFIFNKDYYKVSYGRMRSCKLLFLPKWYNFEHGFSNWAICRLLFKGEKIFGLLNDVLNYFYYVISCYGLNCVPSPPNSYVKVLTPRTSQCDLIWI